MAGDAPDFSVGTVDLSPIMVNTMPILKNYPGGNVFYFDNFEGSDVTWEITKEEGADYGFAEIDKTHAYIGAGCARLYRNENKYVVIMLSRHFQFRLSDTMGVEFSYMLSDKDNARAEFRYDYKIDNTRYTFYIGFTKYYIIISTSHGSFYLNYSSINDLGWMAWCNVKVIINTKDHRYVRLYYGKDVFDIDQPAQTSSDADVEFPHLRLGFSSSWDGNPGKNLWLDKIILTDDETI